MKELLTAIRRSWPRVPIQILDSKQAGDFTGWAGAWRRDEVPPPIEDGHLIWQPSGDDVDLYDAWLEGIYSRRKPTVVVIDELSSLAGPSFGRHPKYPFSFYKLEKQGRGLGISIVTLTQEVAAIPRQVLGQATHIVRFQLVNAYDGREVDRLLGRTTTDQPAHRHGFYYNRTDEPGRPPAYYPSFHPFLDLIRAA
ncbi:MAG TPA: hypothetical protein VFN87_14340 [Solirubrobacteraceae bacterium]|nr:hypothetical protein [Solirubrobacteraceae bacterium]